MTVSWLVVGYTMRPIQPAKNYDVISFARAMNDDFGPKVKKLFDPEREAALVAQETGITLVHFIVMPPTVGNNNNNNNNNHNSVYGAVIMAEPLREFTRFI